MYVFSKKTVKTAISVLICILLAGCGDSPQPVQDTEAQGTEASGEETLARQEDEITYIITETMLPLPERALPQDILRGDNRAASEMETHFWNGSLYRLSALFEMVEDMNFYRGAIIQVLAPPYDHWESQTIYYQEQEDSDLLSSDMILESLAGATENGVLLKMSSDDKRYLAQLEWDGGMEVLLEIPGELSNASWYQVDGKYWALSDMGKVLTVFDKAQGQESSQNLAGRVMGCLDVSQSGERVWYGFDQKELVLWDRPGGQVLTRLTDQIDQKDFAVGYSPTGELFLADANRTWIYEGNTVQEAFAFSEKDYFLQEFNGFAFREDGALLFLARCDNRSCLLTAQVGPAVEKQEVFLLVTNQDPGLEKLVARYNRTTQAYRVTVTAVMDETEPDEYRRRIQMEMTAGRGPDLVGDWTVNIQECIDKGYLEPLDEVIGDRSPFLESALATGERSGKLYGVPYQCYPYFLAVSPQLADAPSWTLEQMYEAVRSSPAEVLEAGSGGVEIVMAYGLHDEENKALIDWEKGESHLAEEPFLKLIAFAKEYADQGRYPYSEVGECLADGRIAGAQVVLNTPEELERAKAYFNGEASCIGYPRESGSGIYMESQRLYLNCNAGNREGAVDFLRYLISEEGQLCLMDYGSRDYSNLIGSSFWARLPVRRSLLEEVLDRYQNQDHSSTGHNDGRGIYFQPDKLDEEQEEVFWRILDNAIPAVFQSDDIWSMVDEELQPYFDNLRSAGDAAAALHSRVQLYLDERK